MVHFLLNNRKGTNTMGTSFITAGYTSAGQRVVLWRLGDYTYEIQGAMKALQNDSKESIFLIDVSYEKALKKFKEYTK